MTNIEVAEGSHLVPYQITILKKGTNDPENLTGYTIAVLQVRKLDGTSVSLTLAITDAVNGIVTWTTNTADNLGTIQDKEKAMILEGQIKLTGASSKKDLTYIIDITVIEDIG